MTEQRLVATLEKLPPSVNKLYTLATKRAGKKVVAFQKRSIAANKYITWASTELAKQWGLSPIKLEPNSPHELTLIFYFPKIENSGWPKTKTRFKKKDGNNYIKLLEDIIATACGVDDSATFDTHVFKRLSTGKPRVEIVISQIEEDILKDHE